VTACTDPDQTFGRVAHSTDLGYALLHDLLKASTRRHEFCFVNLFYDANLYAIYAKRITIQQEDIKLARRLRVA
jgi:hypothetical protein